MLTRNREPIVAIATAAGRGAVGIVRVSGTALAPFVQSLLGRSLRPREASYLPLRDAAGQPIDHGLALFFPAPHSFTGEDVLELQAHGGPVVLQLVVARCLQVAAAPEAHTGQACLPGLRLAAPGEFTERAFLNDKMDLAQAEAVADLIDASTEAGARSAAQSLSGVFSRQIGGLHDALVHLRMLVEATLDFPDEEIDFLQQADAQGQLERLRVALQGVLQQAAQGALLRTGMTVVLAGQPNAGKSSLLNALAGAELAIVTALPGTTRDRVQQTIQIEGVPIHVVDTAGLRRSDDAIEKIGIARAWQAIAGADAVLFLRDLTRRHDADYLCADAAIATEIEQQRARNVPVIEVWNKVDAVASVPIGPGLALSAKSGAGVEALRRVLLQSAGWQAPGAGGFMARERHVQALRRADRHLEQATAQWVAHAQALELLAEELRLAQNALNEITGAFTPDDLLGVIFSKFCIGK
ncbi:MAG: tRNA uridine-5-carboxymethylaminomethyl(34) synthesis GTPase MnmE [Rhodoferax sp.]